VGISVQTKFQPDGQQKRKGAPLRRYLILFQIMIQFFSLLSSELASSAETNDRSNTIGTLFTDSSWKSHVIKIASWALALAADVIRGTKSKCSPALPIISGLFACSATGTIQVSDRSEC